MQKIKAIIFDLGGVILNLDQEKTIRSFKKLNTDLDDINEKLPVFKQYELGQLSTNDFVQTIKAELKGNASDLEIKTAWNKMILNVTADRVELLKKLRSKYKIFLLSNTNELHIGEFLEIFNKDFPNQNWESLFDKIYYSHQIKISKPNPQAWQIILDENNLNANETIFVDDTLMHFKAAKNMGIHSIWAKEPIGEWLLAEIKALEE